jgi:ATP-dependent DNA helicase RecG
MRPSLLYNLFADLKNIKGVGPKRHEAYQRLGCRIVRDLIFHYPISSLDRRASPALKSAYDGQIATLLVKVNHHIPPKTKRMPYKILCSNDTGEITIIYFNAHALTINNYYKPAAMISISGKIERTINGLQMVHPDIVDTAQNYEKILRLEPIYPLTYGLNNRYLAENISNIIKFLPRLPEWIPHSILEKFKFPNWNQAIHDIHNPSDETAINPSTIAKDRLAFDELLAQQLSLQIGRRNALKKPKTPLFFSGLLNHKLKQLLPFILTEDQEMAIAEISKEQAAPARMVRILQGDVGSGKTLVAFAAALNAIEAGGQAALLAPTEILARQHYNNLGQLCQKLDINCQLLIGKHSTSIKGKALESISNGHAQLVIGTHAMIQSKVSFNNLMLAIVDEQHRFGVEQRQALLNKGLESDLLLMSATPIPRTLSMVSYGDLDITVIKQKPKSRLPIITKLAPSSRLDEIAQKLSDAIQAETKAYWLCPLIEESEKSTLTNVIARYEYLNELIPGKVGIIHGQLKVEQKNEVMQQFIAGEIKLLVATTVIEVGVDVPDATVMIIENAERFGLSQLHQLRGRVGRGSLESSCILLYQQPVSNISYERLKVIRSSEDGFEIAQKDLEIRGSGEVLGTRQSGLPAFKNFNFFEQSALVPIANQAAIKIIHDDPMLEHKEHHNLQLLLHLYDHDKSVSYLHG